MGLIPTPLIFSPVTVKTSTVLDAKRTAALRQIEKSSLVENAVYLEGGLSLLLQNSLNIFKACVLV